ncbi:MAG: Gfo/Idh/MocA family oxidoreductase [Saprospiraceae bacterium]|nr:Gfo/Idh/MocA family oxidoreductase [Saprospiraceae bacterium]
MENKPIKIGVLGVGHLGKIHLKCLRDVPAFECIGFFDTNDEAAQKAEKEFGLRRFATAEDLINEAAAVDIVTPTISHFDLAQKALNAGKHVFLEKPVTQEPDQARELASIAKQTGLKIQVGHVERFNPAFLALKDFPVSPLFVEAHRLAPFNPRGTDVSVVLDLMIHDLDLLLSLIASPIAEIHASGVALVSNAADICNARIQFENGCVANLTASRISLKQMRKLRIFQPDAYISLDFLEKDVQIIRLHDVDKVDPTKASSMMPLETAKGKKLIQIESPQIQPSNAIQMELASFAETISKDSEPIVGIQDGYRALDTAHWIQREMENSTQKVLHH